MTAGPSPDTTRGGTRHPRHRRDRDRDCPVGFETAAGTVAATDGIADDVVESRIPDPPTGSIVDDLAEVDESAFWLSVGALRDDPGVREWLATEPERHKIWGGRSDGGPPVRYRASDLREFDWLAFARETSALVHLD